MEGQGTPRLQVSPRSGVVGGTNANYPTRYQRRPYREGRVDLRRCGWVVHGRRSSPRGDRRGGASRTRRATKRSPRVCTTATDERRGTESSPRGSGGVRVVSGGGTPRTSSGKTAESTSEGPVGPIPCSPGKHTGVGGNPGGNYHASGYSPPAGATPVDR